MDVTDLDLNVNNYSFKELFLLFKINDINNPDMDTNDINNYYNTNILNAGLSEQIEQFFNMIRKRLNKYIEERKKELIKSELSRDKERNDVDRNIKTTENTNSFNTLPIVKTLEQKFEYGRINKLYKQTFTTVLNINTRERNYEKGVQQNASNFILKLDNYVKNVISMRVSSFEYPNTVYQFRTKFNTNTFNIITRSSITPETKHIIQIPDGNYNSIELLTVLNAIFVAAGPVLENVLAVYDDKYNKFVFQTNPVPPPPAGFEFDLEFVTNPLDNIDDYIYQVQKSMGWILGFCRKPENRRPKNYYSYGKDYETISKLENSNYVGYIPEALFDSGGTKFLYLAVNDYNNNMHQTFINSKITNDKNMSSILARIPQSIPRNTYGFDDGSDLAYKKREYFGPVNVEKLGIKLIDEYGDIMDINNGNYSFALELECIYNF